VNSISILIIYQKLERFRPLSGDEINSQRQEWLTLRSKQGEA
jgi:hypothetical protein